MYTIDMQQIILKEMEKNYIESGFMYSGAMGISRIERICDDTNLNALNLMFDMIKNGLVVKRDCDSLSFELPVQKRKELIIKHNLAEEWEKKAKGFYPNHPEFGEVTKVMKN